MDTFRMFPGIVAMVATASLLSLMPAEIGATTVSGHVTVNGQKAPLLLSYVDESREDVIVVLTSKEVPSDAIPFIGEEVARKFGIYAVAFTVSRSDKRISPGFNGVFFPGREVGYNAFGPADAVLQMKRLDPEGIEGRISTPKTVESSFVAYSFDVTFSIPLGKAAPIRPHGAVKITGDTTSPPTATYAEYYRAVHAGDVQRIRKFLATAHLKQFDTDGDTREIMLAIMKDNPPEILIGKPVIKGIQATFTVEGMNLPTTKTTAEINMIKEGDSWKVEKERWSTTSR